MNLLEIFEPGSFTAMSGEELEFSETDCRKIASCYDPKLFEAPIVVGHPKTNDPAYGWVKSLGFLGGKVLAEPHQVETQFAEMVNSGRFKKISASFFKPDSPNNPLKGSWYLRHIGFLGAVAPSLKTLKPASFQENETGILVVEFKNGPKTLQETAKPGTRENNFDLSDKEGTMAATNDPANSSEKDAAQKQKEAEFADREKILYEKEQKILETEAKLKKQEFANFLEGLEKEGKFLPAFRDGMVEFMTSLSEAEISFSDGQTTVKKPTLAFFKDYLQKQPKLVHFGEAAPEESITGNVSFAAPIDSQIDQAGLELHQKAMNYMQKNKITDYIAAVKAVGGK